jgi:hypothetical protein
VHIGIRLTGKYFADKSTLFSIGAWVVRLRVTLYPRNTSGEWQLPEVANPRPYSIIKVLNVAISVFALVAANQFTIVKPCLSMGSVGALEPVMKPLGIVGQLLVSK